MAQVEYYVDGLNEVLRAMKALPKEAAKELRQASGQIASRYMAPAWRNAALFAGEPWGSVISDSVKVRNDRIPAVSIGGTRSVYSGGATATMVRSPSDTGNRRNSFAPFERTNWMSLVRDTYQPGAIRAWGEAVDRIVRKWDTL